MERLAVIARLRPGTYDRAEALIEQGAPFDVEAAGLARHAVYLSADEVVFVFEGPSVERTVGAIVNDPVVSAPFAAWGPLLAGNPTAAHEVFYWERKEEP